MAIRTIIHSPNPILSAPSIEVKDDNVKSKKIHDLILDLKDTVIATNGIGIAAPQINVSLRVIVINYANKLFGVINPTITYKSNGTTPLEEGCLSVPGTFIRIVRPKKVVIEGLDENGKPIKINANDMLAKIFQHEIDHINGILISDHQEDRLLL